MLDQSPPGGAAPEDTHSSRGIKGEGGLPINRQGGRVGKRLLYLHVTNTGGSCTHTVADKEGNAVHPWHLHYIATGARTHSIKVKHRR
jgi:hypothetical protein